jgi:NAD(P)-dependent dehydrogenase (short-subunit alcohol dehydrogenase family)
MGDFDRKVAFITGAAHGQGRAVALAFAAEGARISAYDIARQINYPGYKLGTSDELETLQREIKSKGSEAFIFAGD